MSQTDGPEGALATTRPDASVPVSPVSATEGQQIRVAQDRQTALQEGGTAGFRWRWLYTPSADCQAAGEPGQDYLTFRQDDRRFVFALCDGVSGSFYGDLAARILGEALIDWLWEARLQEQDAALVAALLRRHLDSVVPAAQHAVASQPLPAGLSAMHRTVLEEKRQLGSESMLVCGRLDRAQTEAEGGRLVLAWMGDSRLRAWIGEREMPANSGLALETKARWSSRIGSIGSLNALVEPLGGDDVRILAYSDGFSALDAFDRSLSPEALSDHLQQELRSPLSDDITMLEIVATGAGDVVDPALPPPRIDAVAVNLGRLVATWQPIEGAAVYDVQIVAHGAARAERRETRWNSPLLSPGAYSVRIRGRTDTHSGSWSQPAGITIQALDASAPPGKASSSASSGRRVWILAGLSGLLLLGTVIGLLVASSVLPLLSHLFAG